MNEMTDIEDIKYFIQGKTKSSDFTFANIGQYVDINKYIEDRKETFEDKKRIKQIVITRYTVLHTAIENNNLEGVKWLIEKGANVNKEKILDTKRFSKGDFGRGNKLGSTHAPSYSPLMLAMQNDFILIAKILIENGADINDLDNDDKQKLGISTQVKPKSK